MFYEPTLTVPLDNCMTICELVLNFQKNSKYMAQLEHIEAIERRLWGGSRYIAALPDSAGRARTIIGAMDSIEFDFTIDPPGSPR